jgi:hypothetical protein
MARAPPWTSATCVAPCALSLSWSVGEAHSLLSHNSRRALTHSALPLSVHLCSASRRPSLLFTVQFPPCPRAHRAVRSASAPLAEPSSMSPYVTGLKSQPSAAPERIMAVHHPPLQARTQYTHLHPPSPSSCLQDHRPSTAVSADLKPGALYLLSDQSTLTPRCSTAPPWKPPSGEAPPCPSPQ